MKKRIIGIIMIAAIAMAAGWNVMQNKSETALSDIVLSNVEALASGESGIDNGSYYIINVTQTKHTCVNGGPFSCNLD